MTNSRNKFVFFLFYLTHNICCGQINAIDSCGLDTKPILNRYEIAILDSLFFTTIETKNSEKIATKNRFILNDKKIAFYSCTKNSNAKNNGLMTKKEFFGLCRPNFKGHAGRGIIRFTEKEKEKSKGFDAVIIIDCPYEYIKNEELITKLIEAHN
jgi:hypothetical protein